MAGNTNYYQVLDLAGVQQLWNTCKSTFVRTVNGNGIDANGNVQISVAGDFQVNGSSILVNGVANINTESAYNATTNKIATKADLPTPLDAYPVNSIYMSVDSTSPASLFGGTWTQIKDKFLLGAGDTYSNGATGGEATHQLTVNEMPSHNHAINDGSNNRQWSYGTKGNWDGNYRWLNDAAFYQASGVLAISNTGGGQAHNNMPPYLVVYIWKRTA